MQPWDIYNARMQWKGSQDVRPWLIVEMRPQCFGCFPISGHCYHDSCFLLDISDPDFVHTGLKKSCYIHDSHIIELLPSQFVSRRGCLAGTLLRNFREFAGL